jgi:hypothetical protein
MTFDALLDKPRSEVAEMLTFRNALNMAREWQSAESNWRARRVN